MRFKISTIIGNDRPTVDTFGFELGRDCCTGTAIEAVIIHTHLYCLQPQQVV